MAACACGAQPLALPKTLGADVLEELTGPGCKLKPAEVKALYARFRRMAPAGYLLQDQFRNTMGVIGLTEDAFLPERLFRIFDGNKDEKLSFVEFASSLAIMIRGTEEEKLKLSFDMTAGQRDAKGIEFEDFECLIRACHAMMMSLVAPTDAEASDEDIRRLFSELATQPEGEDTEPVILFEDYMAAAQVHDDFLACLGLGREGVRAPRKETVQRPRAGTACQSNSMAPGYTLISQAQLDELRDRVEGLRDAFSSDVGRVAPDLGAATPPPSIPEAARFAPPPRAQPKLRPAKNLRPVEEVQAEFERVIGWCQSQSERASAGGDGTALAFPGQALTGSPSSSSQGPPLLGGAPHGREPKGVSMFRARTEGDLEGRDGGLARANVHTPTSRSGTVKLPGEDLESNQKDAMRKSKSDKRKRRKHRLLGPKKGLAVHFGHENWNMVLSMMIGIRMSIGRSKHEMSREIQPVDFIMKEKFSIIPRLANIFDSEVSKKVTMTRFIDYAPMVFQRIRTSFGVSHDDYLRSVGPEQLLGNMVLGNLSSLSELSSEGKSGAFFYYTSDGKFMIKTVAKKEFILLERMVKRYYDHVTKFPSTMIVRFLGLHCLSVRKARTGLRANSSRNLFFVVMGNMFNTPFQVHRRYDLKGSWIGRVTKEAGTDPSVALKDVDFTEANEKIRVGKESRDALIAQIEADTAFLRDNNIIDYSLLLGIHDVGHVGEGEEAEGDENAQADRMLLEREQRGKAPGAERPSPLGRFPTRSPTAFSGALGLAGDFEVPAHQRDMGGLLSSDKRSLYFMGVIDILTPYDAAKVVEHRFKSLMVDDWRGVSCCPPVFYAERFNDFMRRAFV